MKFRLLLSVLLVLIGINHAFAQARQLTGQHAPANTPALSPAEAQKKFSVPEGFEVRLFAAEPDVINPVAMTWDERGRLWVVELFEYPLGARPGTKPRDRIKILEDTDADGRADKVTIFADGLNLATGIQLGYGGAFVGQAPDLLFLEDTNGDDIADKRTKLMTGFGLEDRHELLNSFTWGPDGWLYLTHGVFTRSKVKLPEASEPGVEVNAAVARFHPRTKKFEVFADGTSNPWGVSFDRYGNAFVSACVIDHLFHMAPGGLYARQSGSPANPYGYELLKSIVEHKHYMAAYAGIQVYQGDQFPLAWRGKVFMGNIHQSAINHDHLTPKGSSFKATAEKDFLVANDGWFRPVSEQVGPDGALWVMDWYDKYPCYQNANADPDGVDRERGRIWRVVYTGQTPGASVPSRRVVDMNMAKWSNAQLVEALTFANVWSRQMAQRILSEQRDPLVIRPLQQLLAEGRTLEARLAALWTLHSSDRLNDFMLDKLVSDPSPAIRMWTARFTGERGDASTKAMARLLTLAKDPEPSVRAGVATAVRQFVSGSLTVNTPPPTAAAKANVLLILTTLMEQPGTGEDPLLPFMIWMALEPKIARNPEPLFVWMRNQGTKYASLSQQILPKLTRRICDTQDPKLLDLAINFIGSLQAKDSALAVAALDGLLEGQKGKALVPTAPTAPFLTKLKTSGKPELTERAQRLGAVWGDALAIQETLKVVGDANAGVDERLQAIRAAKQTKSTAARDAMVRLLAQEKNETLVIEAIRALGEIGGDDVADQIIAQWRGFTLPTRFAAAEVLSSRGKWLGPFFKGLETKTISSTDIPVTVVRALFNRDDAVVQEYTTRLIGRYRAASIDRLKLIEAKKKVVQEGPVDLGAGREIATRVCLVCHKFNGEGAEVGPDLTGVGRSSLDALLANVIDPNQVVGRGYENVEVTTKDGRSISGRLVEDTATRVKLLGAGSKEEIIARSDITALRVSELSVMPEGLEQMPDPDFRNLIQFILNPVAGR